MWRSADQLVSGAVRWGAALLLAVALDVPAWAECQHWLPSSSSRSGHPLLNGWDLDTLFQTTADAERTTAPASFPADASTSPSPSHPLGRCPLGFRCGHDSEAPPIKIVTIERLDAWACLNPHAMPVTTALWPFDCPNHYRLLLVFRLERPPRLG